MLFIFVILAVLKNYLRSRCHIPDYARPLFDTMLIIVIASIPYGFAYGYVETYGFYLGIFAGILHRSLCVRQNYTIQQLNYMHKQLLKGFLIGRQRPGNGLFS
jgi:hypothetical protein